MQAGWITLLLGCVEYDTGNRSAAETTRQAALSLGTEAEHAEIRAWAHEIRAWMALTSGDYHGVVAAARAGADAAPHHSVAVQLAGQEAKAWPGSGTGARPKWRSTAVVACWTRCRIRRTWITTSWLTRPSSTSTRWTATACWPRTS